MVNRDSRLVFFSCLFFRPMSESNKVKTSDFECRDLHYSEYDNKHGLIPQMRHFE